MGVTVQRREAVVEKRREGVVTGVRTGCGPISTIVPWDFPVAAMAHLNCIGLRRLSHQYWAPNSRAEAPVWSWQLVMKGMIGGGATPARAARSSGDTGSIRWWDANPTSMRRAGRYPSITASTSSDGPAITDCREETHTANVTSGGSVREHQGERVGVMELVHARCAGYRHLRRRPTS